MKNFNLKKFVFVTAIILAPSIAFAEGTGSTAPDKAPNGLSSDVDPGLKAGDSSAVGVGQSPTAVVDDATLAANVQNALKSEPNIKNLDIKAEVSNGEVTLTGVANTPRWRALAAIVASGVKGVKSVKNNITVGNT